MHSTLGIPEPELRSFGGTKLGPKVNFGLLQVG